MIDFLSFIVDVITQVWTYFTNFLGSFLALLGVLLNTFNLPLRLTGYVPAILGSSILAVTSISLVKLILAGGNR